MAEGEWNHCWRGCALHISNKLEAREGTEVTDVSVSEKSLARLYPSVVPHQLSFTHWQHLRILSTGSIVQVAPLLI